MRQMISFNTDAGRFSHRVGAVAIRNGRFLAMMFEGQDYWFLPGGRVELNEPSEAALRREMEEEFGAEVRVGRLLWVLENFFPLRGVPFHELGLYYHVEMPESWRHIDSDEPFEIIDGADRLTCRWHPLDSLDTFPVKPAVLSDALRAIPNETAHIVHLEPFHGANL
ncbi:MAG: NUDIX domain-containing protein [SAR202 cluster bacterium]|nr:NUDIX domain-containing protein [SAR202 cluster bacterium]